MKKIIPILGIAIVVVILISLFSFIGLAELSITNPDITLNKPGSIPWLIGSCNDDSNECQQLQKVTFTNTIYVGDDWRLVSEKKDLYNEFDFCRPVVEKKPSSTQTTYEYFFHQPHYRYVTYPSCTMNYKLDSETVDQNGCTIKTWSWYDGVRHTGLCGGSVPCCFHKDGMSAHFYEGDNEVAGRKSYSSGGSEYENIWNCYQTVSVYYKNEIVGKIDNIDDFIIDMDNMIVYDTYDMGFVGDSYDYMRVRTIKHKYVGEPYSRCDYIMNEVSWMQRQCLVDADCNDHDAYTLYDTCESYNCIFSEPVECLGDEDCDDRNPYTLIDTCINHECINSEPVDCLTDNDCEYFENCTDNICITKWEYLDFDGDGVVNKFDDCINTYGNKINGCPTIFEQIHNLLKELFDNILSFFNKK